MYVCMYVINYHCDVLFFSCLVCLCLKKIQLSMIEVNISIQDIILLESIM